MKKPRTRKYKDSSLIEQRNKDLYKAYERVLEKHGEYAKIMPRSMIMQETVESPAPQFYLTTQSASWIINKMSKNKSERKD